MTEMTLRAGLFPMPRAQGNKSGKLRHFRHSVISPCEPPPAPAGRRQRGMSMSKPRSLAPLIRHIRRPCAETASFKIADQKIENLLKRLHDKRVCPCCTARALTYHGASMAEHTMGSAEAIEMFEATSCACTRTTSRRPSRCLQRKRI